MLNARISAKCDKNMMCDSDCPDSSRTLGIIHEFRRLYEEKMSIIEAEGGGDCNLQAKLSLQHDWIRDLNEQNEMLVRAVEELEQEATERVIALEEKLRQSSKCACEVMNGYKDLSNAFQHVEALQEDVCTLMEFIKDSAQQRTWNLNRLILRTVQPPDSEESLGSAHGAHNYEEKMQQELAMKDKNIQMLQQKLDDAIHCKNLMASEIQNECMKCEEMRKSMLDIRNALTAEVADKHDAILTLKKDVQILEEQCKKADQQTHFKDDIIKELRKEIKQLKSETCGCFNAMPTLQTYRHKCAAGQSDSLIDKLNTVCDNIERKMGMDRWPLLTPAKRTFLGERDSPFEPSKLFAFTQPIKEPTPTRCKGCDMGCQTVQDVCTSVPAAPPCMAELAAIHFGGIPVPPVCMPPVSAPPCMPPVAAPPCMPPVAAPPCMPPASAPAHIPCLFEPPVCKKPAGFEMACQTLRNNCRTVPTQYSRCSSKAKAITCMREPFPAQEELVNNTDYEKHPKTQRYSSAMPKMTSPPESSTSSASIEESLMSLESFPFGDYVNIPSKHHKPCIRKIPCDEKCSNDRLRLGSLNLEFPSSSCKVRSGIYKDCRFHNMIQIQEQNQPPVLCSASLINLNEILFRRPRECIAEKIPNRSKNPNQCECSNPKGRPITLANLEQIERNADYLAVKAAIDISQKYEPIFVEDTKRCCMKEKTPPCTCFDRECFEPTPKHEKPKNPPRPPNRSNYLNTRTIIPDDDSSTRITHHRNTRATKDRRNIQRSRRSTEHMKKPRKSTYYRDYTEKRTDIHPDQTERRKRDTNRDQADRRRDTHHDHADRRRDTHRDQMDAREVRRKESFVSYSDKDTKHSGRIRKQPSSNCCSDEEEEEEEDEEEESEEESSDSSMDDRRAIRTKIVDDIVRRATTRPSIRSFRSTTSTDSLLKGSRTARRNKKNRKENQKIALKSSKFDNSEFEIYQARENEHNPFRNASNSGSQEELFKVRHPSFFRYAPVHKRAASDPVDLERKRSPVIPKLDSKHRRFLTKSLRELSRSSSSHSNKDASKKVSFTFNASITKQMRSPEGNLCLHKIAAPKRKLEVPTPPPRMIPTAPPIPRVSRILHDTNAPIDQNEAGSSGIKEANVEYLQGLFDFLRKTKKHDENGIDLEEHTSSHSSCTISTSEKAQNTLNDESESNASEARETIIKHVDWTAVAKLFPN